MSDKLTLDKARELLAEKDAQIQGLTTRAAEAEQAFQMFGITRTEADGGKVSFTSARVAELEKELTDAKAEKDLLAEGFNTSQAALETSQAKVAELEKKDNSVSARAREFLASQGGKPLNISDRGDLLKNTAATEAELNAAIEAEKDPRRRKDLFLKLQELEKKRKNR
jgi:hypothetical protein